MKKINKTKGQLLEETNKCETLSGIRRKRRDKAQIMNINNERDDINIEYIYKIKNTIYSFVQIKFDNLDETDTL